MTKLFLDSGDASETRQALELLGTLDGQTTNPTLVAKNPEAAARLERGEKFTSKEILGFYKDVITEISGLLPDGSVSIEVYSDLETTAEDMIEQAHEMYTWIPNAHIKLPTTKEGLTAAQKLNKEHMRLNLTLCFTQEQAAAVYAATRGAKKGDVYVSPFVGRLDDQGVDGMNFISNCLKIFEKSDHHVETLVASVRSLDNFLFSLRLKADIITAPLKLFKEWVEAGKSDGSDFMYSAGDLKPTKLKNLDLKSDWQDFNIRHELTKSGLERFAKDWNELIK